jgi:3-hydroxyisobutyrate dehydrogenase-like beta-hydroxyacid dehydrogenase
MGEVTIGLLHPGEMGASVGAAARAAGSAVLWTSEGRSDATCDRARGAGLEDAGSLAALVGRSDVVLAVCPPHAALDLARAVSKRGVDGIYVDANAVAPATARRICDVIEAAGGRFVDGGIVGPPARSPGSTRLYLSGPEAARVASLFGEGPLEALPIEGGAGAASALKLAFAAYTKGSASLLLAIRAFALREGVDGALLAEWQRSLPDLVARSEASARGTARKAWRFVGEMEEIARAFASDGLPDGFHRAAARIYARLARFRDAPDAPSLEEVARALGEPERPDGSGAAQGSED